MRPTETTREQVLALSRDPALRQRFSVLPEPIPGNVRFGLLLEVLDLAAGEAALEYVRHAAPDARVVTAAVDEIVLRRVLDLEEDLVFRTRVNHVGRTSMEIGIRVEASGADRHVASCYFTMVGREAEGPATRSIPVPALVPIDPLEVARDRRARERREHYRRAAAAAAEPPGRDEYLLLSGLHQAQEAPGFSGALAGELVIDSWERTYPAQQNPSKVIFGGYIMRRAYELSTICADRVASHRPVITAVNRINFFHPVHIGDCLHMTSRVAYTDGPVICVETSIERLSRDRAVRALSNSCLFTFVNVDPDHVPRPVPPIHPSNWAEDARYLAARRNLADLTARTTQPWLLPRLLARTGGAAGGAGGSPGGADR